MRRYLALTRGAYMMGVIYRFGFIFTILGNIVYLGIAYYLWKSIYKHADVIRGMTFNETFLYVGLGSAVFILLKTYADWYIHYIADKLMELRKNNETHKYLLMRGRYTYMRDIIYDHMTKIIGSPNNISHSAICAEAEKFGPFYTEGYWDYRQYDVLNTKYVLIWGADPLSANRQVSFYSRRLGRHRRQSHHRRGGAAAFSHRGQG